MKINVSALGKGFIYWKKRERGFLFSVGGGCCVASLVRKQSTSKQVSAATSSVLWLQAVKRLLWGPSIPPAPHPLPERQSNKVTSNKESVFKSNHHICRNTCVNSSLLGLYKVVYEVLEGSYVSIDPEMITFFDILMRKIEPPKSFSLKEATSFHWWGRRWWESWRCWARWPCTPQCCGEGRPCSIKIMVMIMIAPMLGPNVVIKVHKGSCSKTLS